MEWLARDKCGLFVINIKNTAFTTGVNVEKYICHRLRDQKVMPGKNNLAYLSSFW
jgi:hypothetical protein